MENRTFHRKKYPIIKMLPINLAIGIGGGLVFSVILKALLYLNGHSLYDAFPWGMTIVGCVVLFVLFMMGVPVKFSFSRARIEIIGDILSEYDASSKLVANGRLDRVTRIDQVRLMKSDAFVVRFSNSNFAAIGEGFEDLKELIDLVASRSGVTPHYFRQNFGAGIR